MGATRGKLDLVEKLFDQALKKKLAQLATEYDPDLVFGLWAQISKKKGGREYFDGWKWTSDMTLKETFSSLDDYLNGLNVLLQKDQIQRVTRIKGPY